VIGAEKWTREVKQRGKKKVERERKKVNYVGGHGSENTDLFW
jgi:hypothetical protein